MIENNDSKLIHLLYVTTAMFGGVANYLQLYLKGHKFEALKLMASAMVSGFSGYMFAQAMLLISPRWAFVAAGVGGFMGDKTMDYLFNFLARKDDVDRFPDIEKKISRTTKEVPKDE
jgi:hypothetical protein